MLRYAAPSPVTALILSDVIGDDLRVVASGPTVSPIGSRAQAREALVGLGIWEDVTAPVKFALDQSDETSDLPEATNILIGSNGISLAAMANDLPLAQVHESTRYYQRYGRGGL